MATPHTASDLFDENVRIDALFPVPMSEPAEAMLELVELREDIPAELKRLTEKWSDSERDELFAGTRDASEAWGELFAAMFRAEMSGFLVSVSAPVMTPFGSTGGASFSWGHIHTDVLWAATADEAFSAALAWGKRVHAMDLPVETAA